MQVVVATMRMNADRNRTNLKQRITTLVIVTSVLQEAFILFLFRDDASTQHSRFLKLMISINPNEKHEIHAKVRRAILGIPGSNQ